MTDSQAHHDPTAPGDPTEPQWPAEAPDAPGWLTGCTVATRDQLPAARVLRDSFLQQHPTAEFGLLLVDETAHEPDCLSPGAVGVPAEEFARLAMACTSEQLRDVLRPRLLRHLLAGAGTVVQFEPWVQVFAPLDEPLRGSGQPVTLVPRVLAPLPVDGLRPDATDLAEEGTFDPAVFAVHTGAEELLNTTIDRLSADPTGAAGLLDVAISLVDHHVVRDPGVGLSAWNATERALVVSRDGAHTANGLPLRTVHFEGFQPQRPWLLSTGYADRPRVLLSEQPGLAGLCAGYRNALVAAGYTREQPHPYDFLPDGTALPEELRREYAAAWSAGQAPPSPFESADEFLEWACAPGDDRQRAAGGSRWTAAVWAEDPVLRRDHPEPFGEHAVAFHEWCVGVGIASGRVPAAAVHRQSDHRAALVDQLGVAVLGGGRLAEAVRAAVRASGLPTADTAYYPVVLRCEPGIPVPTGRHLIDVRPSVAERPSAAVAETWVLSESSRAAARRTGAVARVLPVAAVDHEPVDLPTRKAARARFGISEEYVVAAAVDHAVERTDNAVGLVSAFLAAFPDRDDVRLLIAVSGADDHPEAAERLRLATAADQRVLLVEEDLDVDVLAGAADCVLSLHRDGGDHHVLRLLDVATSGVPVIAGEHGGVAELLGARGAVLVACQGPGEPDIDAAAVALRGAADDPDGTAEFAASAREHLLATHTVAAAGEKLRERVEHAYRNWRTQWAQDRHGHLDDPLRPLLVARHALHRTPDVGVGSRNSMAPALRKAVLRALSHYDEHIRDVLRALIDGVEQTAAELLSRQHDVDGGGDLDGMRGELGRLQQRQEQLHAQLLGTDDGMVRARADLADQHRRLRELEQEPGGGDRIDALAQRIDSLTGAVERIVDRVDALERDGGRALEAGVRSAAADAGAALHRTDVLRRVLLREHQRSSGAEDATTAPVLCDAGLLRFPADDAAMLPWLSSHSAWDPEVSALIDSLLEPDGMFLDVGSYVGYQVVRVLSRFGPRGGVVAVEPGARSRELLRHNVEVNVPAEWARGLVVVDGAAWDAGRELVAASSAAGGVEVAESGSGAAVRGVRLDEELESRGVADGARLSVVHVNVGGRIHRVLRGLDRLLERDRPSVVGTFTPSAITEMGDDPATALDDIVARGYELVPVGRTRTVSPADLLEAVNATGTTSTVKLWLRPTSR
ncbi:FkbM family methyltransferase [Saccharopolyspora sp. CA-218241]|uniref:FkbM family methyltransferase n=1 Tax=Saccharopolyspora sp. CA-218241 TaxID=3240027 RepID=UPI003D97FD1D